MQMTSAIFVFFFSFFLFCLVGHNHQIYVILAIRRRRHFFPMPKTLLTEFLVSAEKTFPLLYNLSVEEMCVLLFFSFAEQNHKFRFFFACAVCRLAVHKQTKLRWISLGNCVFFFAFKFRHGF